MGRTVCATGHRPDKFDWKYNEESEECKKLKLRLRKELGKLVDHGYDYFISGMAIGWDTWFAEAVLELKKTHNLTLELAIPFEGQERKWNKESQERYHAIKAQADIVTILSQGPYQPYLMIKRDEYMVDKSDMLIACYDGSEGGTRHTFSYALDKHLKIIHIDPKRKTVKYIKG